MQVLTCTVKNIKTFVKQPIFQIKSCKILIYNIIVFQIDSLLKIWLNIKHDLILKIIKQLRKVDFDKMSSVFK